MTNLTSTELPARNQLKSAQVLVSKIVPQVSVAPSLQDMTLLPEYLELLTPILKKLGFEIKRSFIESDFSDDKRIYTLITNNRIKRFLLRIPDAIFTNPRQENLHIVNVVRDLFIENFGKKITLYIFHDNIPHATYNLLMEKAWRQKWDVNVKLKALGNIRDLKDMKEKAGDDFVREMFDLDVLPDKTKKLTLSKKVLKRICNLLCSSEFGDEKGLKALVNLAFSKYESLYTQIDWSGSLKIVALNLVKLLCDFGELERGKYALIVLLEDASELVGIDKKKEINELIKFLGRKTKQ